MQEYDKINKDKLEWLESEWDGRSSFTHAEVGTGDLNNRALRAITRQGELLTWSELEEMADSSIDSAIVGWYELGEFEASEILKHCDPSMYTRVYTEEVERLVDDGMIRLLKSNEE